MSHHTSDDKCPLCQEKLILANSYLRDWFNEQIKPRWRDAHVAWAFRNEVEQESAFQDSKTKLHWPNSAHNKTPAMALDLFEIKNHEGVWHPIFFSDVNGLNVRMGFPIVWGAHWRDLGDYDHFEYKPQLSGH